VCSVSVGEFETDEMSARSVVVAVAELTTCSTPLGALTSLMMTEKSSLSTPSKNSANATFCVHEGAETASVPESEEYVRSATLDICAEPE
jgi:hypothetical protein